jgi:hypothetical protein
VVRFTGIGNVTAQAVLDFQLGDERGGAAGVPYSDYTGYVPANNPMDIRVPFDPATVTANFVTCCHCAPTKPGVTTVPPPST